MKISSESSHSMIAGLSGLNDVPNATTNADNLIQGMQQAAINDSGNDPSTLQETFQDFVGQTFFGQMIASMCATQDDAPYFHGGRAEKVFQGQLDQVLAEELSDASAAQFADPMFKLFQLRRQ